MLSFTFSQPTTPALSFPDDGVPMDLSSSPNPDDNEIKDAQLIFSAVWGALLEHHGRDNLRFPREFIWLGGAPGAGKGTNTPFIAQARGIPAPPIVVSALLT